MEITDDEYNKLMSLFYNSYQDEFDAYFRFYKASMDVLSFGSGSFPFSTDYSCVMDKIDKALDGIESNIVYHIREQLEFVFKEREEKNKLILDEKEVKKKISARAAESIEKRFSVYKLIGEILDKKNEEEK